MADQLIFPKSLFFHRAADLHSDDHGKLHTDNVVQNSGAKSFKTDLKPEVVVDKKGLDVHVPVSELGLNNLQGLVNIHFHIYYGPKWTLD